MLNSSKEKDLTVSKTVRIDWGGAVWMCVYLYESLYVCISLSIFDRVFVCVSECVSVCLFVGVCMCVYIFACVRVTVWTFVCKCMCGALASLKGESLQSTPPTGCLQYKLLQSAWVLVNTSCCAEHSWTELSSQDNIREYLSHQWHRLHEWCPDAGMNSSGSDKYAGSVQLARRQRHAPGENMHKHLAYTFTGHSESRVSNYRPTGWKTTRILRSRTVAVQCDAAISCAVIKVVIDPRPLRMPGCSAEYHPQY